MSKCVVFTNVFLFWVNFHPVLSETPSKPYSRESWKARGHKSFPPPHFTFCKSLRSQGEIYSQNVEDIVNFKNVLCTLLSNTTHTGLKSSKNEVLFIVEHFEFFFDLLQGCVWHSRSQDWIIHWANIINK